jgi:hypothetical protein
MNTYSVLEVLKKRQHHFRDPLYGGLREKSSIKVKAPTKLMSLRCLSC